MWHSSLILSCALVLSSLAYGSGMNGAPEAVTVAPSIGFWDTDNSQIFFMSNGITQPLYSNISSAFQNTQPLFMINPDAFGPSQSGAYLFDFSSAANQAYALTATQVASSFNNSVPARPPYSNGNYFDFTFPYQGVIGVDIPVTDYFVHTLQYCSSPSTDIYLINILIGQAPNYLFNNSFYISFQCTSSHSPLSLEESNSHLNGIPYDDQFYVASWPKTLHEAFEYKSRSKDFRPFPPTTRNLYFNLDSPDYFNLNGKSVSSFNNRALYSFNSFTLPRSSGINPVSINLPSTGIIDDYGKSISLSFANICTDSHQDFIIVVIELQITSTSLLNNNNNNANDYPCPGSANIFSRGSCYPVHRLFYPLDCKAQYVQYDQIQNPYLLPTVQCANVNTNSNNSSSEKCDCNKNEKLMIGLLSCIMVMLVLIIFFQVFLSYKARNRRSRKTQQLLNE